MELKAAQSAHEQARDAYDDGMRGGGDCQELKRRHVNARARHHALKACKTE